MGWGQPVAPGKRVHSSTHENSSTSDSKPGGEPEEISEPPPYCSKRAREISPELDSISICNGSEGGGIQRENKMPRTELCDNRGDLPSSVYKDVCIGGELPTTDNCNDINGTKTIEEGITRTDKDVDAADTATENGSCSDSDTTIRTSALRNPNDLLSNLDSKMSQKGNRISQTRKGPRVIASKRFMRNGLRKMSAVKTSSTAQSLNSTTVAEPAKESEEEDSDDSEVFLDNEQSTKSIETSETSSVSSLGPSNSSSCEIENCPSTDVVPKTEVKRIIPAIRPSYFPFVPPYINFCMHDEKTDELPEQIRKLLKWRLSPITPIVVKRTVSNSGYRLLRKTVEWEGQWGKHMKANMFRASLKDFQKLNHIPGTFQIGRKDRLWRNLHRFMSKFGKEEFGFLPRTFILPQETKQLKAAWDSMEGKNTPWIVKPPAAARGTGIRVVNKWNQVPKKKPVIVQSYVANPYLINDRKFDLRLYVLVTDFHPLKIYMYNDGLVRFAPVKYSHDSKRVGDRFMHLTNYSINKNCELYTQNEDAEACEGHKWTLKTLWRYLKDRNINTEVLWEKMEEIVVKTILSAEELITSNTHCMPNRYSGYELFGFDIIIDENLRPWLLEVNISPSLHSSSPLDLAVKGPLIKEVFNIVGFHLPHKISSASKKKFLESLDVQLDLETPVFDKRLYATVLTKDEKQKHLTFKPNFLARDKYVDSIIEALTPDDIRQLILAEDELSQCEGFARIFPGPNTYSYFPYFENYRYYNMLFDSWEAKYGDNRIEGVQRLIQLCRNKVHLDVEPSVLNATSENQEQNEEHTESATVEESSTIRAGEEAEKIEMETVTAANVNNVVAMDIEEMDETTSENCNNRDNPSLSSHSSTSTNSNLSTVCANAEPPCSQTSKDLENSNYLPSTTPSIPLVLDNITNSPRSLIQDVFSNSPSIKCHDEDRLTGGSTNTQQPIGDFIKGICF